MTRRRAVRAPVRRTPADLQPGVPARYPGWCPRCDQPITIGDRVVYTRGHPIHVECHSGQDDV